MYATDFEYAGQFLSDFGFIVCNFDGDKGWENISAGSKITFKKVSRNNGCVHSLTNTIYDECIRVTFQICKNPCIYKDQKITDNEYRNMMRWLNRKEFLDFQPIDEENINLRKIHFNASFNIDKIILNGEIYGLELTMETDKPFGYGNICEFQWEFSADDINAERILTDISDEIGGIYPKTVIECRESGDLAIKNIDEGCETVIKNCSEGEIITIDGEAQIITSSLPFEAHDIATDFNYEFFRIGNTFSNRENKITVSLPCNLNISYYPIIKDIP